MRKSACGPTNAAPLGRYDLLARVLHWIFAVAIIYASVAGYALAIITDQPLREALAHFNMSLATLLIVLFPLRLLWRQVRREPPPLPGVPPLQRLLAHGVHGLLYLNIFLVLSSGFLMVPDGYMFFGWVRIPTPFHHGAVTELLFTVHRICCASLAGLVVLHVLAVVKHQVVKRVNVLSRML